MRFVFDGGRWNPTDGALVPHLIHEGKERVKDMISEIILSWIHDIGVWLGHNGIPLASELLLLWGMACYLMAITGTGKWLEKGTKAIIISVMLGLVRYAV